MSLRQRLLLLFSFIVASSVAAVTWTVLVRVRHVFDQRDQEETALVVSQFQRQLQEQSEKVALDVQHLAATESARAMAFEIVQSGDAAPYLTTAETMARDAQLDFLEIVGPDGNVVSSAQWPARFGYPEPAATAPPLEAFLKSESMPDGSAVLGLFAVRPIHGAEPSVKLIGGRRLEQAFLADLPVASGIVVGLYRDTNASAEGVDSAPHAENTRPLRPFEARYLQGQSGDLPGAQRYKNLIESARSSGQDTNAILYLTNQRDESMNATAIPLKDGNGKVLAVLTVAISRAQMVEAQQHIRSIAYGVASIGILVAIVFSLWVTARISKPIEQLAHAAEAIADGDWSIRVPEKGEDEVGILAHNFNHMADELTAQRERLVQSERVAAWRELARRLAHELKNPLFPLQLTVENLVRARKLSAEEFDEAFQESTATLAAEITNLKTIVGRFSDFSRMPKPELQRVDAKEVIARARSLYETGQRSDGGRIDFEIRLQPEPMPLLVDPELLHRAISNLILNAIDAMPDGGTLTLEALSAADQIEIRVSDTGTGLTPEECERLFTPYYTTKEHGTGLGLAIVQSVIADHGGTIAVKGLARAGTTFIIALPRAAKE